MYLLDTNIFLEGLLEQQKASDVRLFFQKIDLKKFFITDLSLHSIGIILFRLKEYKVFRLFLDDLIVDGIEILTLAPKNLKQLNRVVKKFHLDFDDAYQYSVAEKYKLELISFDKDFDNTEKGRKLPSEVI